MEKIQISKKLTIYCDYEGKLIGRMPSPSNLSAFGSDNSLYFGMMSNDICSKIVCRILDIPFISSFSGRSFNMDFYGENIEVQTNINNGGQLQFKIVGNGQMHHLLQKYQEINKHLVKNDFIIFLDFMNNRIIFEEELNIDTLDYEKIEKSKQELKEIVDDAKKHNYGENLDAFIETTLSIRNRFRNDLLSEFNHKCAICNIDKDELLRASHIVPYSKCESVEKEMINKNNGLLLCTIHDDLFDKNLISFDSNSGLICITSLDKLDEKLYKLLNISSEIRLDSKFLNQERKKFLNMHKIK